MVSTIATCPIPIHLIPSPGARDEFMATIQPVITSNQSENDQKKVLNAWNTMIHEIQQSPNKIILEGYTRDGWAWKPNTEHWVTMTVMNHHENQQKKKLINFVKYLKERQKSAYGRFGTVGLFVVSYVQSSSQTTTNKTYNDMNSTSTTIDQMECRITTDCTLVPNCTIVPLLQVPQQRHDRPRDGANHKTSSNTKTAAVTVPPVTTNGEGKVQVRQKGGGFLGKLVGAQQRTNQHVVASKQPIRSRSAADQQQHQQGDSTTTGDSSTVQDVVVVASSDNLGMDAYSSTTTTVATSNIHHSSLKSAQEVIADFRQVCHDRMLNFDLSDDEMIQIPIVLRDYTRLVSTEEDKLKINMDVLKYIVFEAAEEVNEEWVAHKEPSEFMDDIIITIYKEGAAPDDVLEDMNRAELPEEIRGQQRALQEQQLQQQQQRNKSKMNTPEGIIPFDEEYDDLEALNTKKRDRRTVEDYEREKRAKTK